MTLLDRPYRRLVDDLPLRYVGFTVPDEFFVGYGFDLDERYRGLPDLRLAHALTRERPAALEGGRRRRETTVPQAMSARGLQRGTIRALLEKWGASRPGR